MRLARSLGSADDPGLRAELPTGTVTFVFTDVEGSTSLLNDLGAEEYADALVAHRQGLIDFTPVDRRELHRFEASAREELGLSAYEAAFSEGEALSVEEASDLALSEPDVNEIVADTEGHEAASH